MTSSTLFYMRIKQSLNSWFIYSKKGWLLVLFELFGFISIVYAIMQHYLYTEETSLILFLSLIILVGNSYLYAEKYLSGPENRFDLLIGVHANNIVWAVYGQVLEKNIRVVYLFPLLLMAATKTISPWITLLTFLVLPIVATLIACLLNILINRHWKKVGGIFYLLFSFLWGGSTVAILGFLLMDHNLTFTTLDNRDILFIMLILVAVGITILLLSSTLSGLWKKTYLQNDSMNINRLPFIRFLRISRLFSNSFVAKEWFMLWRNSITKIRLIVWVALILICSFTTLKSYLYDPTLFLLISLVVWLFCCGELPATAWQNEGEQKSHYWLSGFKPSQLIAAKIAAYLPLTLLGILTVLFLGLAIQLSFYVILQRAGLVFWLILSAMTISLAIACLGHNSTKPIRNNAIFEQIPLTISAIAAVGIEFLFCFIIFLPFHWILILSIAIPIICLMGQAIWLSRIYYSF